MKTYSVNVDFPYFTPKDLESATTPVAVENITGELMVHAETLQEALKKAEDYFFESESRSDTFKNIKWKLDRATFKARLKCIHI
jgi:hypothetical protein